MPLGFDRKLAGQVLRLATPVVIAMLVQTSINLLDTIMVGRLPVPESTNGQAAIGPSRIYLWAVGGFLSALGVGTQAITARRFGESRDEKSGQALTNSLFLSFVAGAALSVAAVVATPYLFPLFNQNPEVIRVGVPYSQMRLAAVLSMVVTIGAYKAFYDGIGRTRVHMAAAAVISGTNAIFNYLLIYGNFGFPRLGVVGAGVGSLIASYMGAFILVFWSFRKSDRQRYRFYRWRNLDRKVSWEIVRLSLPSGLATVCVMTGFGLFLRIVSELDAAAPERPAIFTAATQVIIEILSVSFMTCLAFGTATATLVSQSLGRKKPRLAERFGWESVKLGMVLMGALGLGFAVFPDAFLGIFATDADVIDAARTPLRMMGSVEALIAAGMILAQALFGAGNTKFVMYVEAILHFTCLVPLAYVLGVTFEGGLTGIWGAAMLYVALLCGVMVWKFREGKWKTIQI